MSLIWADNSVFFFPQRDHLLEGLQAESQDWNEGGGNDVVEQAKMESKRPGCEQEKRRQFQLYFWPEDFR